MCFDLFSHKNVILLIKTQFLLSGKRLLFNLLLEIGFLDKKGGVDERIYVKKMIDFYLLKEIDHLNRESLFYRCFFHWRDEISQ